MVEAFTKQQAEALLRSGRAEDISAFNSKKEAWRKTHGGEWFDASKINLNGIVPQVQVDLRWVNLNGADLCGAKLSNSLMHGVSLEGALVNTETELPSDIDKQKAGLKDSENPSQNIPTHALELASTQYNVGYNLVPSNASKSK